MLTSFPLTRTLVATKTHHMLTGAIETYQKGERGHDAKSGSANWRVHYAFNPQFEDAIDKQDADQKETNFQTGEASVRAVQASVLAAPANLGRLTSNQDFEKVRAPFAGVIDARNFDIGALISTSGSSHGGNASNSTEMFRLARVDILRILVNVHLDNAPGIKAGQMGEVLVQDFRIASSWAASQERRVRWT